MDDLLKAINEKAKKTIPKDAVVENNIDTQIYTMPAPREKKITTFDSVIPQMANFNHQADLLILPNTTKDKFIGMLVITDLGVNTFDIEPIKNKESKTILDAMKKIYDRGTLSIPKYSFSTDDGSEFKGDVAKWLYDKSIFHKVAMPNRHSQQGKVERLNQTLGKLLNAYMNQKEELTGEPFYDWVEIVDLIRNKLNKILKRREVDWITGKQNFDIDLEAKPKYKIGDVVFYKSDYPLNALGHKQPTNKFRTGDYRWNIKEPRKIMNIYYYPSPVNFRYGLEDMPNVSYTEEQLRLAPNAKESKYVVQEIIGRKMIKGKPFYLVWWKGYPKKESTLEPRDRLLEDGFKKEIEEFDSPSNYDR